MTSKIEMKMDRAFDDFLEQVWWNANVFASEVKNDEKVDCVVCQKPISVDPAFIHRYEYVFCHFSCLNAPTNYKALLFHFGLYHDRLIFTEEVKSDGKEDVLCLGCEKPVLGPGYKCSTSNCNLLLHKSCVELSPQIQQHPFHPNHILVLVEPADKKYCNVCGKNCNRYPFYRCRECDFNLDITCASTRPRINNIDDCQHAFIPFFRKNQFTCNTCGEDAKELASQCTICQLLIHGKCARFQRIIWTSRHGHSLALTYSVGQVKQYLDNNVFCRFCSQRVKTEYAAYYCKECDYVTHLDCAIEHEERGEDAMFLPKKSVDSVTNVMEVEGAGQIKHFSHQHDLILGNEELVDVKFCDGCTGLISTPFYSCMQCNFFLHSKCVQLPRKKIHMLHQHQLTLVSHGPYSYKYVSCDACKNHCSGFTYRCNMCNFDLDLQCCSISETLKHEGHEHSLFLAVNPNTTCHVCNATYYGKLVGMFVCTSCDFALGYECATLPLVAKHIYDDHFLKLTYIAEDHCEEYYCLICEEKRDQNHWFYYCAKCDFSAHPRCVLGKYS